MQAPDLDQEVLFLLLIYMVTSGRVLGLWSLFLTMWGFWSSLTLCPWVKRVEKYPGPCFSLSRSLKAPGKASLWPGSPGGVRTVPQSCRSVYLHNNKLADAGLPDNMFNGSSNVEILILSSNFLRHVPKHLPPALYKLHLKVGKGEGR